MTDRVPDETHQCVENYFKGSIVKGGRNVKEIASECENFRVSKVRSQKAKKRKMKDKL